MKGRAAPITPARQPPADPNRKRVILLSGGLDSAALVAWCGAQCVALTVDYGQRSRVELMAARAIADHYGVEHVQLHLPGIFPGSALTGAAPDHEGPCVVPGRNGVLLALACSLAESRGIEHVSIGATESDARDYADCRAPYIEAMNATLRVVGSPVEVSAPFVAWSKREVVWLARQLSVPLQLTHSCYYPMHDGQHCGRCASCRERMRAM